MGAPMSDPRDEIARIIADAEAAAYQRGWNDAVVAITDAAEQRRAPNIVQNAMPASPMAEQPPARPGRPASNTVRIVSNIISKRPGMSGVEIVKAAQAVDGSIKERTVRTSLRRLRLAKVIWRRAGLWYSKTTEKSAAENANGEVLGPPPH